MLPRIVSILVFLTVMLGFASAGEARNVPGSASAVLGRVDREVSSSIVDSIVGSVQDVAGTSICDDYLRKKVSGVADEQNRGQCEFGLTFRGNVVSSKGDNNGFDYDAVNEYGMVVLSGRLSSNTLLVGGVLFELGQGDSDFNQGKFKSHGLGGTLGLVHDFSDDVKFIIMGGAEFLDYDVSRNNGAIDGNYDAVRLFADAELAGRGGEDSLWIVYRGGLRLIDQNNDGYTEESGGIPGARVGDTGFTTLSAVADIKFGTTLGSVRPYLELSGVADIFNDEKLASALAGLAMNEEALSGRVGIGFDAEVGASGRLSMTGGTRFGHDGYSGFDVGIGYSNAF